MPAPEKKYKNKTLYYNMMQMLDHVDNVFVLTSLHLSDTDPVWDWSPPLLPGQKIPGQISTSCIVLWDLLQLCSCVTMDLYFITFQIHSLYTDVVPRQLDSVFNW